MNITEKEFRWEERGGVRKQTVWGFDADAKEWIRLTGRKGKTKKKRGYNKISKNNQHLRFKYLMKVISKQIECEEDAKKKDELIREYQKAERLFIHYKDESLNRQNKKKKAEGV